MSISLKGRNLLTLMDFTKEEIIYLLDLSATLKRNKKLKIQKKYLNGKNIVLLFEKTSTRTRCAFEVAAFDEGAHVTFLDMASSQMNKKESLEDTAKVLGRFYDGIEYRGFEQRVVEDLAKYSGIPVWNGLTDIDHPTQILADLLTIRETIDKPLENIKVVFVGDTRNNVAKAWMYGAYKLDMTFVGLGPKELHPNDTLTEQLINSGAKISFESDISKVKDADVIYTDVWVSMGEEALLDERVKLLTSYRVTSDLVKSIGAKNAIFMHDLPSFHDFETDYAKKAQSLGYDIREVDDEVFKSEYSVVFQEAENRMHTIKAVMVATLADDTIEL